MVLLIVFLLVHESFKTSVILSKSNKGLYRELLEPFQELLPNETTTTATTTRQGTILASKTEKMSSKSFARHILCPHCRWQKVDRSTTCQDKLQANDKDKDGHLPEGIANDPLCQNCFPQNCTQQDKILYPIDKVAPKVLHSYTHVLDKSIPQQYRAWNQSLSFFAFNPSIIRIPHDQKPTPDATYLAAFRVSTQHVCFPVHKRPMPPKNYMGFATLNQNMEILQETVKEFFATTWCLDPRLHVLDGHVYLSTHYILQRIWLTEPDEFAPAKQIFQTNDPSLWNAKTRKQRQQQQQQAASNNTNTEDTRDNSLQVLAHGLKFCSALERVKNTGKNLNYFVDERGRIVMETMPMNGPYEILDMNSDGCQDPDARQPLIVPDKPLPMPSFGTSDEMDLARQGIRRDPFTAQRGGYCCIGFQHDGQSLLLGVSHSKIPYSKDPKSIHPLESNHYFSSFYALERRAPYNTVARTGKFCLPYETNNPNYRPDQPVLRLGNATYDTCPKIHFVSGMVRSVSNEEQLIISYGVNDCISRFVVVEMDDIVAMLFDPHSRFRHD